MIESRIAAQTVRAQSLVGMKLENQCANFSSLASACEQFFFSFVFEYGFLFVGCAEPSFRVCSFNPAFSFSQIAERQRLLRFLVVHAKTHVRRQISHREMRTMTVLCCCAPHPIRASTTLSVCLRCTALSSLVATNEMHK